jgi:hypothetical protein
VRVCSCSAQAEAAPDGIATLCLIGRVCLLSYELACEHAHSCCILLADKRFKGSSGEWHTWIDFDKFIVLAKAHQDEARPPLARLRAA